jgi:hypothetical protein
MRFPRFTGRWRDDKRPPQDATTIQELIDLYHTARRAPAATLSALKYLRLPSLAPLPAAVSTGEPTVTGRPDR